MNEIKFRGRSFDGKNYCGELQWIDNEAYHELHKTEIKKCWLTIYTGDYHVHVIPDSVAQYAFTDSNGHEVYTGDMVVSEDGTEYTVKLVPIAENENEYVRLDLELDNRDFVLKEKKS